MFIGLALVMITKFINFVFYASIFYLLTRN
jgi:hypothetical protein